MVCGADVPVAVKTMNPQHPYKTIFSGLLSEMNVFSHVGCHPNIINLLGANTSSLKICYSLCRS